MGSVQTFSYANESISLNAMEYGCELALLGVKNIQERLYAYGRIPLNAYWMHRFPRAELLFEALIGSGEVTIGRFLLAGWLERPAPANNDRWRLFYNRKLRDLSSLSVPYKLYVNLYPEDLIRAFSTIIDCLASHNVPVFKFSKDVYNLVRPDKFVVYLTDFETLLRLGTALSASLRSARVQPLPFTAAFDELGTVSCGFDPPKKLVQQFKATSWRGFVTQQIAGSFAESAGLNLEKATLMQHALEKMDVLGIDTQKWLPKKIA